MAATIVAESMGGADRLRRQSRLTLAHLGIHAAWHVLRRAVRPAAATDRGRTGVTFADLQCAGRVLRSQAGWRMDAAFRPAATHPSTEGRSAAAGDALLEAQRNRLHPGAGVDNRCVADR